MKGKQRKQALTNISKVKRNKTKGLVLAQN
jgi:hypothetical protein